MFSFPFLFFIAELATVRFRSICRGAVHAGTQLRAPRELNSIPLAYERSNG